MRQLETIEAEILQRRETYNQTVERYNVFRVRVPQILVANICRFEEAPTLRPVLTVSMTLLSFIPAIPRLSKM